MKTLLTVCAILVSASAFAAPPVHTTSGADNEVSVALGMKQGAFNLGAEYERRHEALGWGGYFLFQTSKDKNSLPIVNQVMSLGGQAKIHLVENGFVDTYIAPGVGLHMIKDVIDNSASSGKTDVTAFGPSLRIGVLVPLTPTMKLGLSHLELWNWFDEKAAASYAFYQASLAFDF